MHTARTLALQGGEHVSTADAVHSRRPRQPDAARASRREFFVRAMSRGCMRCGLIDLREQKSAQP
jgi:hypothetical protein